MHKQKCQRSPNGHHLNKLGSMRTLNAIYQVSRTSVKEFQDICAWRPSWSFNLDHLNKYYRPIPFPWTAAEGSM